MGILGQEAVTGVDGIDVADFGGTDDPVNFEITFLTGSFTDTDCFVRQLNVQRIDIRRRVNRQRFDAKFLAGADDPQSDFAAVGDQDLIKHGSGERRGWG